MSTADYELTIGVETPVTIDVWQSWIDGVVTAEEILFEKRVKPNKKNRRGGTKMVNIRPNLRSIALLSYGDEAVSEVTIAFTGSAKNDGTLLSPEQLRFMLEQFSEQDLSIVKSHRKAIVLEN